MSYFQSNDEAKGTYIILSFNLCIIHVATVLPMVMFSIILKDISPYIVNTTIHTLLLPPMCLTEAQFP